MTKITEAITAADGAGFTKTAEALRQVGEGLITREEARKIIAEDLKGAHPENTHVLNDAMKALQEA